MMEAMGKCVLKGVRGADQPLPISLAYRRFDSQDDAFAAIKGYFGSACEIVPISGRPENPKAKFFDVLITDAGESYTVQIELDTPLVV